MITILIGVLIAVFGLAFLDAIMLFGAAILITGIEGVLGIKLSQSNEELEKEHREFWQEFMARKS